MASDEPTGLERLDFEGLVGLLRSWDGREAWISVRGPDQRDVVSFTGRLGAPAPDEYIRGELFAAVGPPDPAAGERRTGVRLASAATEVALRAGPGDGMILTSDGLAIHISCDPSEAR